ncbi:MAG TPA: transmembrane 220 family protein [Candidatus Krumholzibacteria bacterium]|jgi:hypothetical protein
MRLRRSKWVAALLFLYAAAVQYNDPDMLPWFAVYLGAAILSGWAARRSLPRWAPAALGLLALIWMGTLLPTVFAERAFTATEIERESFGLLLVAVWMVVLFRDAFK